MNAFCTLACPKIYIQTGFPLEMIKLEIWNTEQEQILATQKPKPITMI